MKLCRGPWDDQGVGWVLPKSVRGRRHTDMCIEHPGPRVLVCPNEATSPTVHTQSFGVGTKQFRVPLPLEECFKNNLTIYILP